MMSPFAEKMEHLTYKLKDQLEESANSGKHEIKANLKVMKLSGFGYFNPKAPTKGESTLPKWPHFPKNGRDIQS